MDPMALYQIQNVTFAYAGEAQNALQQISLSLNKGDFVLFCGPTGSGKTTLLRLLKKEVQPAGKMSGIIVYDGNLLEEVDQDRGVEEIAMVFQDPDDQIVMETVWQELIFAMENLGYEMKTIQRRLAEVANYFGMESWLSLPVHHLSGGQKQLLNLAAVMMLRPKVLLLDEPTAQLDPIAAREFLQVLYRINQELSTTIILSEHRLEEVFPLASRIIMLEQGKVKYSGDPHTIMVDIWKKKDPTFWPYLPVVSRLYLTVSQTISANNQIPLTVKAGKAWADRVELQENISAGPVEEPVKQGCRPLLDCREVFFQYEKDLSLILKGVSLQLERGEIFTLFGGNGSGKTTLLKVLTGIMKPIRGKVFFGGKDIKKIDAEDQARRIGYLAQNPSLYFNRETVAGQIQSRADKLGLGSNHAHVEKMIHFFELKEILDKHPYDISGGQRQKVALALVLLSNPDLILLDEPTKGLDPLCKQEFGTMLQRLHRYGSTILMVSHDIEFAAQVSSRCALLFDGKIIASDTPRTFFTQNYFYTTFIHRVLGEKLPRVIGIEDVTA